MDEELTNMDVWKDRVQQDINDLKQKQSQLFSDKEKIEKSVQDLQMSDKLQDREINSLKETLADIKSDTNFIRGRMDKDRDEQLKQYKNLSWKVVGAILTTGVLILLGLQFSPF